MRSFWVCRTKSAAWNNKIADIVAVPGNPAENIRQTEKAFFVMKEGVIYRNDRGAAER